MKLQSVRIQGFRSILDATLMNCGGFNVLIGKNNAGKSNVLLALSGLFGSLQSAEVVSVDTRLADELNFCAASPLKEIRISAAFELSTHEISEFLSIIISNAPQVRNAFEGLSGELDLEIIVVAGRTPSTYSCVESLALVKRIESQQWPYDRIRDLLKVVDPARTELVERSIQRKQEREDIKGIDEFMRHLGRFPGREWERLRERGSPEIFGLRRPGLSRQTEQVVRDIFRSSDSATDMRDNLQALRSKLQEDIIAKDAKPLNERVETVSGTEDKIPDYVTHILRRLASTRVLYLTERRRAIGPQEASQLLDLKVSRGGPEKLREIQTTVDALLGVEIDAFRSERRTSPDEPEAELDVDRFLVQVNGAGVREALRLILDYEFERPNILLVEEPEIHLHPALELGMMRYLKTIGRECQIFVTTHSTNFLDTAEMRNVYLTANPGSTAIRMVNVEEAEESIPRELGLRLSSVFMFDQLVFVEGTSDEEILREIASTLSINLAQANVGFVPMEGVRNISHFAAERTIAFLSKRQVRITFITDRDERESNEIQQLVRTIGSGAALVVLKRREIENYLIAPRAIAQFLQEKAILGGGSLLVSEQEVQDALETAAERLQEVTIRYRVVKRVCPPTYFDRRSLLQSVDSEGFSEAFRSQIDSTVEDLQNRLERLGEVEKEERRNLEENWAKRKFELVPGDLLLDAVCQNFGLRFKKERDSARLARSLRESEIPQELKEVLTNLVGSTR